MKKKIVSTGVTKLSFLRGLIGGSQRGVSVVELVLVAAVLVVLGVLVLPNLNTFLGVDKKIADANLEAANIKSAAISYELNHQGEYPADSDVLLAAGNYIPIPHAFYTFDVGTGRILTATTDTPEHTPGNPWTGIIWSTATDTWIKN